ncbi:MAG: hypothetical protein JOZ47_11570 [Kutzneria sp.]|nr:hypothetical protein [Kutzneria sp.]MBV9845700.1 hypothetical protein [Kutzneria sp.]
MWPTVYQKYGLSYTRTRFVSGRQGVHVRFLTDPQVEFEGFFWPAGVIETTLVSAGFTGVQRQPTKVPGDISTEQGSRFWDELLANPYFAALRARAAAPATHPM